MLTSSTEATFTDDTVLALNYQREPDGKITVIAVSAEGELLRESLEIQEVEERSRFLNNLCAKCPGFGGDERDEIRNRLLQIARASRIDLRFDVCGRVNGRAVGSARLFVGNNCIDTASLNFLSRDQREKAIRQLAQSHVGRRATARQIEQAVRDIRKLIMKEINRLLQQPVALPRLTFSRGETPYRYDADGIVLMKKMGNVEVPMPLTDFIAKISAEILRDDGSGEPSVWFEIEASAGDRTWTFSVPADEFQEMKWISKLGPAAVIYPGQKEHARTAILKLNPTPPRRHIHTHLGWIKGPSGGWGYLHAGGIISAADEAMVTVSIAGPLAKYRFPEPPSGAGLIACIRSTLNLLELGPAEIVYPLFCAPWRAVLGRVDHTLTLVGPSGVFKSELLALAAQHFGPDMVRTELPASWNASTINALGEIAFLAKDALLPIDEYKLLGNSTDDKLKQVADNMIQNAGNGAGKGRMKAAGGLWAERRPRASLLSSGEHVPGTKSCISRQFIVEVRDGDISEEKLSRCQADAARGNYAATNAAFIRWLAQANRIEQIRTELPELCLKLRSRASASTTHRRTPGIVSQLYAGLLYFLNFAVATGALTEPEQKHVLSQAWHALGRQGERQREYQQAMDPAARFIELLDAALSSGEAHLAGDDGNHPGDELALACGWWKESPSGPWQRKGPLIGYWTREAIALVPDAAHKAIERAGGSGGGSTAIAGTERELRRRLHERGMLIVESAKDKSCQRLTMRRMLGGRLRTVLLLRHEVLPLAGARNVRNDCESPMF